MHGKAGVRGEGRFAAVAFFLIALSFKSVTRAVSLWGCIAVAFASPVI